MRKITIMLMLILTIVFSVCLFAGCNETPDNTGEGNNGGTMQTPGEPNSSENPSNGETTQNPEGFTLTTNLTNSTINGEKITVLVSNDTSSCSFINAFSFPDNYRWELHWDKSCLPSLNIVSKSVDLDEGDNTLYALFVNKNDDSDIYLYEINIHRIFNAEVRYYLVKPDGAQVTVKTDYISTKQEYVLSYKPDDTYFSTGYSFSHYENESHEKITSINISAKTNVYIIQKPLQYTITLDINGGDVLSQTQYAFTYNSAYELPEPTKTDYTFKGWYKKDSNQKIELSGIWNISNNLELIAEWEYSFGYYGFFNNDATIKEMLAITQTPMKDEWDYSTGTRTYTVGVTIKFDPSLSTHYEEIREWFIDCSVTFQLFLGYQDANGDVGGGYFNTSTIRGQISHAYFNQNELYLGMVISSADLPTMVGDGKTVLSIGISDYKVIFTYTGNILCKK